MFKIRYSLFELMAASIIAVLFGMTGDITWFVGYFPTVLIQEWLEE